MSIVFEVKSKLKDSHAKLFDVLKRMLTVVYTFILFEKAERAAHAGS
jgi:hypothetical protein